MTSEKSEIKVIPHTLPLYFFGAERTGISFFFRNTRFLASHSTSHKRNDRLRIFFQMFLSKKVFVWNIVLFLALFCLPSVLFSAGTPAGTVITSRTKLTFTTLTGSRTDTIFSNAVSITVAQSAGVNITPVSNQYTTPSDSIAVDFPVSIINSGNGADVFLLSAVSKRNWSVNIYHDANGDGILQSNEMQPGNISNTSSLPADGEYKVILRTFVPHDEQLNGKVDSTVLTVKSQFSQSKTITGNYLITVHTANLLSIKTGLSVDNNNPNQMQNVIYTLSFSNTGNVQASNIVVKDLLPSSVIVVSGSASQGSFVNSGNPVQWNIGNLVPNATVTLTLVVQVKGNVPPNSIIQNSMTAEYAVGTNSYQTASNVVSVTVGASAEYGVTITPMQTALTKESGDTAIYRYSIKNIGRRKDVIELDTLSSRKFSWKIYRDQNNNGQWDPSDIQLTNTNNNFGIDVDSLAAGDSVRIFAVSFIPRIYLDQTKDELHVTARSAADTAYSNSTVSTTTINAPMITLSLSPFPTGDLEAGRVVTYTISYANTGHASVSNFTVTDPIPQFTDYVANSIKVNGVSVSDVGGAITFTTDDHNRKVVNVSVGNVTPQQNGSVEFKVRIQ